MTDRETNKIILEVMLNKLSKRELIESLIEVINIICEKDEDLDKITHFIITQVNVREIIDGNTKLENFAESYRKEIKEKLKKLGWSENGKVNERFKRRNKMANI